MSGSDIQEAADANRSLRITGHPMLGPSPSRVVVTLSVDGREIEAFEGEPVAVTMLASGIRTSRTMPETGSARGYFCGVGRCTDCQMTVDGALNVRTCVTPVVEGMIVTTQQGLGEWTVQS